MLKDFVPECPPAELSEADAAEMPFCTGIPPGSSEAAIVGKVAFVLFGFESISEIFTGKC